MPGQPPANVEYRRRKERTFPQYIAIFGCSESVSEAQKELDLHSLEFWDSGDKVTWGELKFDDPSLQPDHGCLGSVAGAQFRKDILDSPLDGLLSDRELIGDLFVGIARCDQA